MPNIATEPVPRSLLVQADGLGCRHGRVAVLAGIDLRIAPGEVVGLVGANGSGKSTLLRCIGGLQHISVGALAICGRPLAQYSRHALARTIAYVPQLVGASMALRVAEMVALGRLPHRGIASENQSRAVVAAVISRMQLEHLALRHFNELSGGERQRVLIARALAQEGRLLLLDEPTSGLDLRHQLATLSALRGIADEGRVGALVAIHDLALAARFCDRLLLLRAGRVLANGPWREVLTPANVEALFGVQARIGDDASIPYVIPLTQSSSP